VTGKVCYYNKETGMLSEEPPVQAPSAEDMANWETVADDELPPGWEVRVHPTTGELHYYHPNSNTLTTSRPQCAPVLTDKGFLAEGWEERVDPVTGKVSYFNKETGMESDEPPVQAASVEVMATWAVAEDPEPDKGPLPPGWEVRTDPETGEILYYNPSTNTLMSGRPKAPVVEEDIENLELSETQDAEAANQDSIGAEKEESKLPEDVFGVDSALPWDPLAPIKEVGSRSSSKLAPLQHSGSAPNLDRQSPQAIIYRESFQNKDKPVGSSPPITRRPGLRPSSLARYRRTYLLGERLAPITGMRRAEAWQSLRQTAEGEMSRKIDSPRNVERLGQLTPATMSRSVTSERSRSRISEISVRSSDGRDTWELRKQEKAERFHHSGTFGEAVWDSFYRWSHNSEPNSRSFGGQSSSQSSSMYASTPNLSRDM
jgi:hypothetical protein